MGKFLEQMKANDRAAFSWAAENASQQGTLAEYLDTLIKTEDRIEQIVRKASAEASKRRHQTMYTEGTIHSHIKYRIQQAGNAR